MQLPVFAVNKVNSAASATAATIAICVFVCEIVKNQTRTPFAVVT